MTESTDASTAAAVVEVAKEQLRSVKRGAGVLSSGVRATLRAVPMTTVQDVTARINRDRPKVPQWANPHKDGKLEDNPNDPDYQAAVADWEARKQRAIFDAYVMWGVELADPLPEDDTWLKRLQLMDRRGAIDLEGLELSDPVDREFAYKRFVACSNEDIFQVAVLSGGVSAADLERAAEFFRGETPRGAD